jgi:5-methylcytosine-specific restriction endonuclease McrA
MRNYTFAKIAYDAYCKQAGGKSLATGDPLPEFYSCERCGKFKPVDLHHLTYARLGHEEDGDLKLYCRDCHNLMHPIVPGAAKARWAKKGKK